MPGVLDLPPLDEAGYEEMVNDPAWIEQIEALAEAHAQRVSNDSADDSADDGRDDGG